MDMKNDMLGCRCFELLHLFEMFVGYPFLNPEVVRSNSLKYERVENVKDKNALGSYNFASQPSSFNTFSWNG